jgi:hypothetical protein
MKTNLDYLKKVNTALQIENKALLDIINILCKCKWFKLTNYRKYKTLKIIK